MKDFAEVINKVSPQSILQTAVPKPKVDFVRELVSTKITQLKKVLSISDIIEFRLSPFKKSYFYLLQ